MSAIPTPDARLQSAISYIKKGGTVADIGTDHAYLPIHLVKEGLVRSAIAADINLGPILSARANIEAAGLSKEITAVHTDGLHGIEAYAPDDILIFGMGGELIVKILTEAPWIQNAEIGLILQPMSRAAILRSWLTENGFSILGESLTDCAKYYQTIYARYDGKGEKYTEEELLLGRRNIEAQPPLFEGFVRHELKVHQKILAGKRLSADADTQNELRVIEFLNRRLENLK
ncbi:MAG: SAM-dependent methyltransferase [Clostridia bacterium]|nr:SAM-dependent methyltransferase [Clostridia bacterium]